MSTPTFFPSDLTIVRASPSQRLQWAHHAHDFWAKKVGVSGDEFVENQRWMEEFGKHASDGRIVCWVLVPRSDTDTTDILASCRTMRRDAKAYSVESEEHRPATSYVITSVVTPSQHRKKGYANQLLSLLHYLLAPSSHLPPFPSHIYGVPPASEYFKGDALYSTLWSDVGEDFYRKCRIGRAGGENGNEGEGGEKGPAAERDGWVVKMTEELQWDLPKLSISTGSTSGQPTTPLESAQMASVTSITDMFQTLPPSLVEGYERDILEAVARKAETSVPTRSIPRTIVLDSANSPGLMNYYLLRSRKDSVRPETTYGYISLSSQADQHPSSGSDKSTLAWVIWCPIYDKTGKEPPTLRITSLGFTSSPTSPSDITTELEAFLPLVFRAAKEMACTRITAWGLEETVRDAWLTLVQKDGDLGEAKAIKRKEHVGAIAWYGEGPAEAVKWVGGEELTWA